MPTIEDVREFWDANPLWIGEAKEQPGTKDFFDTHTRAYVEMTGGRFDDRFFPVCDKTAPILDLGCGIGYWPEIFGKLGFTNITGADLSGRSLELAKRRCELNGIEAKFSIQNAEAMTFSDDTFDHINCIGVIHHSPEPVKSIREIYRVLKPGGRAVVSVYYMNAALRAWPYLRKIGRLLPSLKGRGREEMLASETADEVVRLYDGSNNPIGTAYSRADLTKMLEGKRVTDFIYHSFPSRVLPIQLPGSVVKMAEQALPFMIAAVVEKS